MPATHATGWPDRPVRDAPQGKVWFSPMTTADVPSVHEVEKTAYPRPWTQRHFTDSIQAGYAAMMLMADDLPKAPAVQGGPHDGQGLLGYVVAMEGVDEVHLLNITVVPALQRQGWGRVLMDALVAWAHTRGAESLWLEVRLGNHNAQAMYTRYGFVKMGVRRDYYPAGQGQREDAVVMQLALNPQTANGQPSAKNASA
ncbi:ribosomal protein S18-alanine N-acetyltransferase [Hydrogenophaga sp. 5NK40-0174]|uniref:ribosomal protein S18-alanine N-acetyltransferase n=1 Tax=Hydrogenophaga sp. 5NK40-0174 TaxID=3127649 RepID=UPI0031047CF0